MDRGFEIERPPEHKELPSAPPERAEPLSREPERYELGPYRYLVNPEELETMIEIGRFRTIEVRDLGAYRYAGRAEAMRKDLTDLKAQGLVQLRTVWSGPSREKLTVAVLTKQGKTLVERALEIPKRNSLSPKPTIYSGLVKPAELRHDAAIYRMFQAEKLKIERDGGRVRRVILDYELKRNVYRPLAKSKPKMPAAEYAERQAEVARQNGLKVTGGKILLPDVRIEYETANGAAASVDLEYATDHYRGAHMRGKAQAGFKFYASPESAGRLGQAFDPEIVADILSF